MLAINSLKFVRTKKEFTESLFQPGGTAYGFYRPLKGRVLLMNMQGEIFAAIICHDKFKGIVNAGRLKNGSVFYQYGLSDKNKALLGLPEKYSEQEPYAESLFNQAQN